MRDGQKSIKQREEWVGLTTNREPRTIVGIHDERKTVVFMVVDGRQPGYSMGLSGDELAEYLLSQHITNAIMLDGGASSTMVLDGKLVNRPSYKREERMIGGCITIKFDK